jgi:hypothetical protein
MPYEIEKTWEIDLGDDRYAQVSFNDYVDLADFRWFSRPVRNQEGFQAARYVTIDGKRRLSYLHNEIMQPPEGSVVVFLDGDRLDCRPGNLLVLTKGK